MLTSVLTVILTGIVSFYEQGSALLVLLSLLTTILSGYVLTITIRRLDSTSIVSVRRILGLLSVSTAIWIIPIVISLPFNVFFKNAIANEFVFGSFLAWGFELVVISGAFLRRTSTSILISAIHPAPIVLLTLIPTRTYASLPATGVLTLIIMIVLLERINHIKTKKGVPSLEVLRAFLKTWVEGRPDELEAQFSTYSSNGTVSTDVIIADGGGRRTIMIVPGIHPGPFAPVGSYDLSELLYDALKRQSTIPVILHGTGGHERNVPVNRITREYSASVSTFVTSQKGGAATRIKGPLRTRIGITNITTVALGNHLLTMISNAPYRSDDLDPVAVSDASAAASELDAQLTIIDAHNSVDGEIGQPRAITRGDWTSILRRTFELTSYDCRIASANSHEVDFAPGQDISEGGISVVIFASAQVKHVLVAADSNNAKSGMRETLESEIRALGMDFLELCTSDTHKLAARNLTNRGYFALGEQTPSESIIKCIRELVIMADTRLHPSILQISTFRSEVPLIGEESIDDLAELTKDAISTTKRYMKVVLPALIFLLIASLLY